jgi:S-adenosylmethionine-diacylgycerolhomoserine-N-methlytransferase
VLTAARRDSEHAELMDNVYRYQRHFYDFTRKYYLFGRDSLIDAMALKPGSRAVEVGCGTARNLIRMVRRYPDARLFGLDASEAMLETAAAAIAKAGLESRIGLSHGYAEALSPQLFGLSEPFDDIVFSYSLSMIPDWKQALRSASEALSPTGRIHIVDFGDLAGLPAPARKALLKWLALFHVSPRMELLGALEQVSEKYQRFQLLRGRYAFSLSAANDAFSIPCGPVALQSHGAGKSGFEPV